MATVTTKREYGVSHNKRMLEIQVVSDVSVTPGNSTGEIEIDFSPPLNPNPSSTLLWKHSLKEVYCSCISADFSFSIHNKTLTDNYSSNEIYAVDNFTDKNYGDSLTSENMVIVNKDDTTVQKLYFFLTNNDLVANTENITVILRIESELF